MSTWPHLKHLLDISGLFLCNLCGVLYIWGRKLYCINLYLEWIVADKLFRHNSDQSSRSIVTPKLDFYFSWDSVFKKVHFNPLSEQFYFVKTDFLHLLPLDPDRPVGVAGSYGCWGVGDAECHHGWHRGVDWWLLCLCSDVWSHAPSGPCRQQVRHELEVMFSLRQTPPPQVFHGLFVSGESSLKASAASLLVY